MLASSMDATQNASKIAGRRTMGPAVDKSSATWPHGPNLRARALWHRSASLRDISVDRRRSCLFVPIESERKTHGQKLGLTLIRGNIAKTSRNSLCRYSLSLLSIRTIGYREEHRGVAERVSAIRRKISLYLQMVE